MESKLLNAVKTVGLLVLSIGVMIFSLSFWVSDYEYLAPIGIGTVVGAVFIFLIGVFFVATEEMLNKTEKGIPIKK
ncbi:hypothetical protein [Peribacillus alkalitolerans]|uniref:hypothetical protein n=1 Tax=Peribacillus alkalitolerans TaxID=1550385 RepID=UPI0013D5F398|nr:hypothetical protein [Peribacillus alkalitolerans]